VRLKYGDPRIIGRGADQAAALTRAGIAWSIITGVIAACAAAAAADSFLTERGQTECMDFATGHRRDGCVTDWAACAAPGTTLACHMGVSSAAELQKGLIGSGSPKTCLIEVVSRAQTPEQRVLRGTLEGLARLCQSQPDLKPAILLIHWPKPPLARTTAQLAPRATVALRA
jgi:siroheme synthase